MKALYICLKPMSPATLKMAFEQDPMFKGDAQASADNCKAELAAVEVRAAGGRELASGPWALLWCNRPISRVPGRGVSRADGSAVGRPIGRRHAGGWAMCVGTSTRRCRLTRTLAQALDIWDEVIIDDDGKDALKKLRSLVARTCFVAEAGPSLD